MDRASWSSAVVLWGKSVALILSCLTGQHPSEASLWTDQCRRGVDQPTGAADERPDNRLVEPLSAHPEPSLRYRLAPSSTLDRRLHSRTWNTVHVNNTQWITLIISTFAFTVSLITLWRTHLAPGRLKTVLGDGKFEVKRYAEGGDTWLMPTLTIPMVINNSGARAVHVVAIRVLASYPDSESSEPKWEIFHLMYEIDPEKYSGLTVDEAGELRRTYKGPGVPFTIGANKTEIKNMTFTTRWDYPISELEISFEVQIQCLGKKKWQGGQVLRLEHIPEFFWQHPKVMSLTVTSDRLPVEHFSRNPKDLHRRTSNDE